MSFDGKGAVSLSGGAVDHRADTASPTAPTDPRQRHSIMEMVNSLSVPLISTSGGFRNLKG